MIPVGFSAIVTRNTRHDALLRMEDSDPAHGYTRPFARFQREIPGTTVEWHRIIVFAQ
jgi:hypothetical protein